MAMIKRLFLKKSVPARLKVPGKDERDYSMPPGKYIILHETETHLTAAQDWGGHPSKRKFTTLKILLTEFSTARFESTLEGEEGDDGD